MVDRPGAGRRESVRRLVGRPGSWTRWFIGSAVWMTVWLVVFALGRNLLVLLLAVIADGLTLLVRPLFVGDEDELHADLRQQAAVAMRDGVPERRDPELTSDPAGWFTHGDPFRMSGAPPPPSAEQEGLPAVPVERPEASPGDTGS